VVETVRLETGSVECQLTFKKVVDKSERLDLKILHHYYRTWAVVVNTFMSMWFGKKRMGNYWGRFNDDLLIA